MEGGINIRVIADLHIHSRFSRATSEQMTIKEIARYAKIKGLQLVGTGDFTHPHVAQRNPGNPHSDDDSGLFKVSKQP